MPKVNGPVTTLSMTQINSKQRSKTDDTLLQSIMLA